MFRATDPNAIKTVKHPADLDAEFDISISMSREDRTRYSQELADLSKETPASLEKQYAFWEKLTKKHLKAVRGVEDASGGILALTTGNIDAVVKALKEVRVEGFDNLAVWLGQMIFAESVLTDDAKKKYLSALTTLSTGSTSPD